LTDERHVLVVDGPAETETVLRAVLNPKGVAITRIRSGSAEPDGASPNVVVLHKHAKPEAWPGVARVLIGSAKAETPSSNDCYLDGPFEYKELVATIDRMLTEA
jgi:DNA-binding response OmpR family regulator